MKKTTVKNPFKALMGHRVLINLPEIDKVEESKDEIVLIGIEKENRDKKRELENYKKFTHLVVYAVGNACDPVLQPGDEVQIPLNVFTDATRILVDGQEKLLIRDDKIDIIW